MDREPNMIPRTGIVLTDEQLKMLDQARGTADFDIVKSHTVEIGGRKVIVVDEARLRSFSIGMKQ